MISPLTRKWCLFLALITLSIDSALALNCTNCMSLTTWDECKNQSQILECSVALVNELHGEMAEFNPTLKIINESATVSFQCFSIELQSKNKTEGESDRGFVSGCTFKQQKICDGWKTEVQLIKCDACETEKICSLNSGNRMSWSSSFTVVVGVVAFVKKIFG